MITITKTFKEPQDMEDFIKAYFVEFHPAGYGTQVSYIKATPIYKDGLFQLKIKYEVTLERLESCD